MQILELSNNVIFFAKNVYELNILLIRNSVGIYKAVKDLSDRELSKKGSKKGSKTFYAWTEQSKISLPVCQNKCLRDIAAELSNH